MKSNWLVFPHSLPFSLELDQSSWDLSFSPGYRCLIPDVLDLDVGPPGISASSLVSLFPPVFLLHSPTCVDGVLELCSCMFLLSFLQVLIVAQCLPGSVLHISILVILIVHSVILQCWFFHSGERALPEVFFPFFPIKRF